MCCPKRYRLLAAAALAGLALALPLVTAQARPVPQFGFGISPTSGPPGTAVTLTGYGWTPNSTGNEVHWDSQAGPLLGTFAANPNGAFTTTVTVPSNASAGTHSLWACDRCHSIIFIRPPRWASAPFIVIRPPTATPSRTPTRTPTPTPIPPSECDLTGGPGESVIDFEAFAPGTSLRGVRLAEGVIFDERLDPIAVAPENAVPRSGSQALQGPIMEEFVSFGRPIRFILAPLAEFVGVSVGLEEPTVIGRQVTAELVAYGLDQDGRRYFAGRDSLMLGPGTENIHHCLSVSDPRIYEVAINYLEGEPELIDDLVVRRPENPEEPPPDDDPPTVTITAPLDGATISTDSVRLEGEVIEDRDLESLQVMINGASYREIGFSEAGDAPDWRKRYIFALDAIPVSQLLECVENEIRVVARDATGNSGQDAVNIRVLVGDLSITQVEPVQVVFGAPLVRDKNTAFRVRVSSTFACPVTVAFRLRLPEGMWDTSLHGTTIWTDGERVGYPPGERLPEITLPVEIPAYAQDFAVMLPVVPEGQEEAAYDPGSNPAGLIGITRQVPRPVAERVTMAVMIDPDHVIAETDEMNNQAMGGPYPVVTTRGLSVMFVPWSFSFTNRYWESEGHYQFYLDELGYADPDGRWWDVQNNMSDGRVALSRALSRPEINRIRDAAREQAAMLLGGFPVAEGRFEAYFNDLLLYFREEYFRAIGIDDYCDSTRFLSEVRYEMLRANPRVDLVVMELITGCCGQSPMGPDALRAAYVDSGIAWPSPPYWRHYCGYPPPEPENAATPTPEPWPFPLGGAGVDTILHELAHNYTGAPDCYNCDDPRNEASCYTCVTDADGYWVNRWLLIPAGTDSFMHAVCQGCVRWWRLEPMQTDSGGLYPDGYRNLVRYFTDTGDPQGLLVFGTLTRDGMAAFLSLSVVGDTVLDLETGSPGAYTFVLKDAGGRELVRTGFTPSFEVMVDPEGTVESLDESSFVYRIPWEPSAARIELQDSAGNVLAWRAVSANPPTVELLSPTGGETWTTDRPRAVRWRASDPDGDPLEAAIQASLDGGESWLPVVSNIEGDEYKIDAAMFGEGQAFLLRVIVNDGIYDAVATVGAPLTAQPGRTIPENYRIIGIAILAAVGVSAFGVGFLVWRRLQVRGRKPPEASS